MTELEKLRQTGAQEFRMVPIKQYMDHKGKRRTEYEARTYIPTQGHGDLEEKDWTERAWAAVNAEGMEDLYKAIRKHMEGHVFWLHKEEEKKRYALKCLIGKAYEYWEDFTEYEKEGDEIIWL